MTLTKLFRGTEVQIGRADAAPMLPEATTEQFEAKSIDVGTSMEKLANMKEHTDALPEALHFYQNFQRQARWMTEVNLSAPPELNARPAQFVIIVYQNMGWLFSTDFNANDN